MISVIVPVYNAEKFIDRCIKSILNQNYNDFEIILVDDGSPDKCPKICDEWAEKDERIKVIHKIISNYFSWTSFSPQCICNKLQIIIK